MKIYVKSNSNVDIAETISVIVDIEIPDSLYANVDPVVSAKQLYDSVGNLVLDVYEELLDTIDVTLQGMGLERVRDRVNSRSHAPNGDPSNSVYFDYVLKDHKDSQKLHMVFYLRVSDHRDEHGNHNRHANRRNPEYQASGMSANNGNNSILRPFIRRVTVDNVVFNTDEKAIDLVISMANEYIRSEQREFEKYESE